MLIKFYIETCVCIFSLKAKNKKTIIKRFLSLLRYQVESISLEKGIMDKKLPFKSSNFRKQETLLAVYKNKTYIWRRIKESLFYKPYNKNRFYEP